MRAFLTDTFGQIAALTELLEREIAALEKAELDVVAELLPQKTALATALEAKEADIATALAGDGAEAKMLRMRIARLKDLLARDGELVGRMAGAMRDVASELTRLAERDSLASTYDATGAQVPKNGKNGAKIGNDKAIDKSL
jgi:hypothetical protein